MKYLKVWTGVTSGSHLGRDDGYPEEKIRVINSLEELVTSYSGKATYYKLSLMDIKDAVKVAGELL